MELPKDIPPNLPNLWEKLASFRKAIGEVHASLTNPQEKQALGELLTRIQNGQANLEKVLPPYLADMEKRAKASEAKVHEYAAKQKQLEAEFQAKLKELEEAEAKGAEAPAPPPPARIDPNLSSALAAELLGLFAPRKTAAGMGVDPGSVADEWVETDTLPDKGRSSEAPKRKANKEEPEPKKDDIWEGLSRMED